MSTIAERKCPGCKLRMPLQPQAAYGGYYHCSPECWSVYGEVLGFEFSNAVVFSQVHQMTVDAYAVQHAGGPHPDKSVTVHLAGLHAAHELGLHPMRIPGLLQSLANNVSRWPCFEPPAWSGPLTVFDVALAGSPAEHVKRAKKWSRFVWDAWSSHHGHVAALVEEYVPLFA